MVWRWPTQKERHGGNRAGERARLFPFLYEECMEPLHVFCKLLRGVVPGAGGTQPAIGEAGDAAPARIAAPAADSDRQLGLLHGFRF